jgi:hypothetical protein
MELRVVKGPLDDAWLRPVVELYGAHRGKYRDLGYCRSLFNGNPHGYSWHAFLVRDGGDVVGHYCIIPTDILVDGTRRPAGKAEALVVHPDHRGETVPGKDGGPVLCGLAMPARLYQHALDQGMQVVHMIPDPEVQVIYPITGSRPVSSRQIRERLFVSPVAPSSATAPQRVRQAALARVQRAAFEAAYAATLAGTGRSTSWGGSDLTDERLDRIAADVQAVSGWTVAIDAPTVAWFAGAGSGEVIALDDSMDNYAVVTPRAGEGQVMEVLFWRQRTGGVRSALRLLGAVVRRAESLGDLMVGVAHQAALDPVERSRLGTAARLLAFQRRSQETHLFVSTRDRYYMDPANLFFTPFFYGIF